ncbi:ribose-5-phosphate isomerase A [Liquorilactobacillus satsumensis]|uniref:ribose-5-phosphate isomerase n=1 Tax=Liquorilactobacillus satsumensis DSM 16230 = JCM 12392 TaxID=1423801 RepID=A0A0R1UV67_9LACO|nr:ribose-5-phosphate isomerase A [Liquorilactobacillus satsumensis]KRL97071.1 ribose 5-phosphate isomerase [Liquorilactobacillus satsumensis DSM 16230 = JCM 12392]
MRIITAITERALEFIKPGMTISLGGGSNVHDLAVALATKPQLKLTLCTPSELTYQACLKLGLKMTTLTQIKDLDLAFDGCDSLDYQLRALKSNGGIHTLEKICAQKAQAYIILTKSERLTPQLNPAIPLTLEVISPAVSTVSSLLSAPGIQIQQRLASTVASFARTPSGNCLLDCYAQNWHEITTFAHKAASLNGVIGTSFFEDYVTNVLALEADNSVKEIRKDEFK